MFVGVPLLHHIFVSDFDVGEGGFVAQTKERFGLYERVRGEHGEERLVSLLTHKRRYV